MTFDDVDSRLQETTFLAPRFTLGRNSLKEGVQSGYLIKIIGEMGTLHRLQTCRNSRTLRRGREVICGRQDGPENRRTGRVVYRDASTDSWVRGSRFNAANQGPFRLTRNVVYQDQVWFRFLYICDTVLDCWQRGIYPTCLFGRGHTGLGSQHCLGISDGLTSMRHSRHLSRYVPCFEGNNNRKNNNN